MGLTLVCSGLITTLGYKMNTNQRDNLIKVYKLLRLAIEASDAVSDSELDFPAAISSDIYDILQRLSFLKEDANKVV